MKTNINKKLEQLSQTNEIEILFAVESGSRAWGFASPDSDYDIRFVFKHKSEWYLNLWEQKDTLEFMTKEDLDGSGWDIKKTCKLMAKSNVSVFEWLFSPIVYQSNEIILKELQTIAQYQFNPVAGFYHYHSMSQRFESSFTDNSMTLKHFFYALRSTLCAEWIIKEETIPPVPFKDLLINIPSNIKSEIDKLIIIKSTSLESDKYDINVELIDFVQQKIKENDNNRNAIINKKPNHDLFNQFFKKTIL